MSSKPLEFKDFSGGVTDYFLNAPLNRYEMADNFVIIKYGEFGRLFTRPGSEIWDDSNPQIPAGNQRVGTLKYFNNTLLVHSATKFYYVSSGSFTTLQGPSSNDVFPTGVTTTNYVSFGENHDHLLITSDSFNKVQKVYPNASNVLTLRTAGLPEMTAPTVTKGGSSTNNYIYRFHYQYTYTVGTLEYIDVGPTVEVAITSAAAPNSSAVAITNIPVISNGSTYNYDTASANLVVKISRTINNGQVFYYVGSVQNGTTSFNDNVSDATLQTNELLYTSDGSVDRYEPPLCKYVHVVEDKAFFAHIKDGSEVLKNRVYQSIPGDIDAIGDTFYCDTDFEIKGISSFRGIPILPCVKGAYRIDGAIDALGRGNITARKISDTASCVSSQSVIQTPDGVFWAGLDGFYYSDGYNCFRINDGWDKTYKEIVETSTKQARIYGKYDSKKNRILWACSRDAENLDNNACWVLDLNYGVSNDMPFTSFSGASFNPTALEFTSEGNLIRSDKRGYIFIHRDTLYADPKVDVLVSASDWTVETIVYNFKSAATDFGTTFSRKWVTGMNIICQNETNLSLQPISNNDKDRKRSELSPIRFRGNLIWGEADVYWGDPTIRWNYAGLISHKRRMPKGSLRCEYKQIELTNAFVALFNSDLLGACDIDSAAKTLTLTAAGKSLPTILVDYYVAFEVDNYTREYLVLTRNSDTELTFSDVGNNSSTASSQGFVIRGYPRNELLFLIGFNIHYEIFGQTQDVYRNSASGEVDS